MFFLMDWKTRLFYYATTICNWIFEYDTPKIIAIRNIKIGIVYRCVQLFIIVYFVGYVIIFTKGYQDTDVGQSSILTKVKGVSSSINRKELDSDYRRVWDSTDYVVPPLVKNSVFIKTNMMLTIRQRTGKCAEDSQISEHIFCNSTFNKCPINETLRNGNGPMTGKCSISKSSCEIESWCPIENDTIINKPIVDNVENFTIFFKNVVEFLKFHVKRKNLNIIEKMSIIQNCSYHPFKDPFCPVLKIGDILKFAKGNITRLLLEGGIINILVRWDCNLDYNLDYCKPQLTFSRLDTQTSDFSTGFNFRYANYYRSNGILYRDLIKAYGLLFVFNVEAHAGKFDTVQLGLNIGAGLALLGFGSFFMDVILVYFSSNRRLYQEHKFIMISQKELKLYRSQRKTTSNSDSTNQFSSPSMTRSLLSSLEETEFYDNDI